MKLFAVLSLAAGAAGLFGSGDPNADRGKQVVDQALAALGGDRFLNYHSRITTGRVYSFFRGELSEFDRAHIYTEYVIPAPAGELGLRERELLGKKQDYSFLFLPDKGFELTFRGARPVETEQWDRYRRSTENDIFYILKVRHDEPGITFDYAGNDVFLSRHVDMVDITDNKGRVVKVYFDYNTHYPIRQSFTWVDDVTRQREDEIAEYDKFRDIGGGVYLPYTIERSRNGYKVFQVFADSVQANVEPPAHTFELPAGVKTFSK